MSIIGPQKTLVISARLLGRWDNVLNEPTLTKAQEQVREMEDACGVCWMTLANC